MPTPSCPIPRQEREAKALMETLRCLVCQGQSIADSDAEMAGDMRAMVRQRILAGERPEQIRAWLISRYGNWVSYDPPLEPATWPALGSTGAAPVRRPLDQPQTLPAEAGLMGWAIILGLAAATLGSLWFFGVRDKGALQFPRRRALPRSRGIRVPGAPGLSRPPESAARAPAAPRERFRQNARGHAGSFRPSRRPG
jgi:hypothetical protein